MRHKDEAEERRLVKRAKEGDMEAFESLVRRYQQSIFAFCYRMTGTPQSADDLAQETFLKAYLALRRFDEERNFFSWIRRIALNGSLNFLKVRKREGPLGADSSGNPGVVLSTGGDMPLDELQKNRTRAAYEEALGALPSKLKAVFVLRVHESLSYGAIARTLHIPRGTVMSRLNRARRALKEKMGLTPARRDR